MRARCRLDRCTSELGCTERSDTWAVRQFNSLTFAFTHLVVAPCTQLDVRLNSSLGDLKRQLGDRLPHLHLMRLLYAGRLLSQDERELASFDLYKGERHADRIAIAHVQMVVCCANRLHFPCWVSFNFVFVPSPAPSVAESTIQALMRPKSEEELQQETKQQQLLAVGCQGRMGRERRGARVQLERIGGGGEISGAAK